ncbi:MAG: hypothetical protein V4540_02925 [Pseudomonadota bacterium]|jgi:hypothetical protein
MNTRILRSWIAAIGVALLAGCGGGGGGGGANAAEPVASPNSFALASAYGALIRDGESHSYSVTGTCAGTATIANAPAATAGSFEGFPGYSASQVVTLSWPNCTNYAARTTGTTYYNDTYLPVGLSVDGGEYAVATAAPTALPSSVVVGNTGKIVTMATYRDSSKTIPTGTREFSYKIERDTATTAVANITVLGFDTYGQPLSTQESRYRMAVNGGTTTLTLLSVTSKFTTLATGNIELNFLYTVQ